jgi:anaerobic ribonucleoside-triphosphate reductase
MIKDKMIGEGVPFTHIARITGYLATTQRFNSAKLHELTDRVKHSIEHQKECKRA